jgi:hypothetical protein
MQICKSLEELVGKVLPLDRLQLLTFLQGTRQIRLHTLEHRINVLPLDCRRSQLVSSSPAGIGRLQRSDETRGTGLVGWSATQV